jgi:hypothetical protein
MSRAAHNTGNFSVVVHACFRGAAVIAAQWKRVCDSRAVQAGAAYSKQRSHCKTEPSKEST